MLHPTGAARTSPSPTYLPIQPKGRTHPHRFSPCSPVHTLRPVFPRRAGLPAAPSLVPGDAAAVPGEGVAGAVQAVAAPLARRPPKPSLALALARLLGAGREVAGALEAAPPAPPARQAAAVPAEGVAVRAGGIALALLLAAGGPPARLAAAGASQGLAAAVGPALAGELAQLAPAIGVAGAAPARRLARPAGVARAPLLAVGAPVLRGAACGGEGDSKARRRKGGVTGKPSQHPGEGWRRRGALTGAAVCAEEAGFAAAKPGFHAHLVRPAGVLPFAQRCRGTSACAIPTGVPPRMVPTTSHTPSPPAGGWHPPPHHRHPAPHARWMAGGSPRHRRANGMEKTPSPAWGRGFWVSSIDGLPAVHSRPSCFQPGQHARPAGGLWDREGTSAGDSGGTRAGYVCVQLQGFG